MHFVNIGERITYTGILGTFKIVLLCCFSASSRRIGLLRSCGNEHHNVSAILRFDVGIYPLPCVSEHSS